jgi:periplasmic protein TonB
MAMRIDHGADELSEVHDKPIYFTLKSDLSLAIGDNPVASERLADVVDAAINGDKEERTFIPADRSIPLWRCHAGDERMRAARYLKVALVGVGNWGGAITAILLRWFEDEQPRDLLRWGAAAAIVLGVHAVAIAFYLVSHQPDEIGGDDSAVAIELAPIENTPDAVERDVTPAPEKMVESQLLPKPPDNPPEQKIEQAPPEETPTIIPEHAKRPPEKIEKPKPPAPVTAQRVKGGAPQIVSSWQSNVVKHLQRYKRYPSEALSQSEEGVVLLSFRLDRNGYVLTHHIARSSGYADLDNEVMDMITRAQPLPAFPANMPQTQLDLTVPISFSMH